MLAYGGWATVSGVISPILTVFDRLVIGAIAGMGAVATYSVPFNIVIRLGLFPTSVQSALFGRYAMKSEDELRHLLLRSIRLQAWMMTPIVLFGILMIRPFLQAWVGAGFAASTKQVGEILLLGLWFSRARACSVFVATEQRETGRSCKGAHTRAYRLFTRLMDWGSVFRELSMEPPGLGTFV